MTESQKNIPVLKTGTKTRWLLYESLLRLPNSYVLMFALWVNILPAMDEAYEGPAEFVWLSVNICTVVTVPVSFCVVV